MKPAVLFSVEGEHFALPLESIASVMRAVWPTPMPRAPYGCLGLVNVRGTMTPMVDLAPLLGLRRALNRSQLEEKLVEAHLMLARSQGLSVQLLVDRVLELGESVDPATASPQLPGTKRAWYSGLVVGLARSEQNVGSLLDLEQVLGANRRSLLRRVVEAPGGTQR